MVKQRGEFDVQVGREPMPRLEGSEERVEGRRAERVGVDL